MKTLFIMLFILCCLGCAGSFFLTTTGFWLLRTRLAHRSAVWKNKVVLIQACKCSQVHFNCQTLTISVLSVCVRADDVPQGNQHFRGNTFFHESINAFVFATMLKKKNCKRSHRVKYYTMLLSERLIIQD